MKAVDCPLSVILRDKEIYKIFDDEFSRYEWLDASALLGCEASVKQLMDDQTVPKDILERIIDKLPIRDIEV